MARPRLPDAERRDDRLPNLRVTAAERADVEARAVSAGLSLVEFCRRAIFRQKIRAAIPQTDAAALHELNRVGVNLNQLARAMNAGRELPASLEATMQEVRAAVEQVARRGP